MNVKLLSMVLASGFLMIMLPAIYIYYRSTVEPSYHHPAVEHPEVAGKRVVYREEFSPPVKAHDFELLDKSNVRISLKSLRGKLVLISFIYTSCPDVCPILTNNYVYIQKKLENRIPSDLVLVFITTDPARDDAKRLRQYTKAYGGKWYFLTGSLEELKEVWKAYDVFVMEKQEPKGVVVYHSYKTYLIDKEGMLRIVYVGLYDPDVVVEDIKSLLEESS